MSQNRHKIDHIPCLCSHDQKFRHHLKVMHRQFGFLHNRRLQHYFSSLVFTGNEVQRLYKSMSGIRHKAGYLSSLACSDRLYIPFFSRRTVLSFSRCLLSSSQPSLPFASASSPGSPSSWHSFALAPEP